MFIANVNTMISNKSRRDDTTYIPYLPQQSISPDFGILKNENILHRILKSINVPSLRDYQGGSVPMISINIPSLREFLKQSGTDTMFIATHYVIPPNQFGADDMFIAQGNTTTHHQSHRDEMFIETGIQSTINKSRRDDMFISQRNITLTKSIKNQTF